MQNSVDRVGMEISVFFLKTGNDIKYMVLASEPSLIAMPTQAIGLRGLLCALITIGFSFADTCFFLRYLLNGQID